MYQQVLDDCTRALASDRKHARAYEDRGSLYLILNQDSLALADGDSLIKVDPGNRLGYSIRGTAYQHLNQPEKAVLDYTKCIELFPEHDFAYVNRGTILFSKEKFQEALNDFSKAIAINPLGSYYLNRSFCYFRLGDLANAKADMDMAMQKGENVSAEYKASFK